MSSRCIAAASVYSCRGFIKRNAAVVSQPGIPRIMLRTTVCEGKRGMPLWGINTANDFRESKE